MIGEMRTETSLENLENELSLHLKRLTFGEFKPRAQVVSNEKHVVPTLAAVIIGSECSK